MNTETPGVDRLTDASDQSRKRPAPSPEGTLQRRSRGRYTPVACDGCKKRKMKCIPVEGKASCERCLDNSIPCRYTQTDDASQGSKTKSESRQYHALKAELAQLREEFAALSDTVKTLSSRVSSSDSPGAASASRVGSDLQDTNAKPAPKQPKFVGPTSSALGFDIGQKSLTRMGIPTFEENLPSRSESPEPELSSRSLGDLESWPRCSVDEVVRLLRIFKEEIESVYPFVDTAALAAQVHEILKVIQSEEFGEQNALQLPEGLGQSTNPKDVDILKLAMCIAIVLEKQSKTELTTVIVKPIERSATTIFGPEADLKQVQLLILLSSYYFLIDEDILAWRTIGIAGRTTVEMGLHRKRSLLDNFHDESSRQLANRVFWCTYLLDRRYSFCTGLSFSIPDNDIDPDLLQPGPEFAYLHCMIGYGKIGSKTWDTIPPFRSPLSPIPKDIIALLDRQAMSWMESIPPDLKLRHPRERPAPQPNVLHRLRTMLYLRGNHTRILIYKHHLFSAASIVADPQCASLVIDVAKDSVEVLVHLNQTSDIYSRQQSLFNYFLVTAMSAMFLAVCHAPKTFSEPCRKSFSDAVEILRGLSRHGAVSRRTWKTIRGLLPRLKRLGLQELQEAQHNHMMHNTGAQNTAVAYGTIGNNENGPRIMESGNEIYDSNFDGSIPDVVQMGDDLMDLFDMFGQPGEFDASKEYNETDPGDMGWEGGAFMLFPGFI